MMYSPFGVVVWIWLHRSQHKKDRYLFELVKSLEGETIIKKTTHDKIETKVDPSELAIESLKLGVKALSGEEGPMADCIKYGAAIILNHVTGNGIRESAIEIKKVLKSGSALKRFI